MSWEMDSIKLQLKNLSQRVMELEAQVFEYECEFEKEVLSHSTHSGKCSTCDKIHSCEHEVHQLVELPRVRMYNNEPYKAHCTKCCFSIYECFPGNFEAAKNRASQEICNPVTEADRADCETCTDMVAAAVQEKLNGT